MNTSTTATPITGRRILINASSDWDQNCLALQSAIDRAIPGDAISVPPAIYRCGSLELRRKIGDGWITIKSSKTDTKLPPEGNRVSPTDHVNMPVIISPGGNVPPIRTESGAHNYRLIGLEVTKLDPGEFIQEMVVVDADDGVAETQVSDLSAFPHDIIIDRCYIHGLRNNDLKRGIRLYCMNCGVVDSYIADAHVVGQEAQAILLGGGPLKIANNYLEAAGENIFAQDFLSLRTSVFVTQPTMTTAELSSTQDLSVGAGIAFYDGRTNLFTHITAVRGRFITYERLPSAPSLSATAYWGRLPTDVEISKNYLFKPLSLNPADPSYAAYHPTVKNIFELKSGRRVWFHDNLLINNWVDGQDGTAILLTVRNQHNSCFFCAVEDVTIENNIVSNVVNGVAVLATDNDDVSGPTHKVLIRNNLFTNVKGVFQQGTIDAQTIDHNTLQIGGYVVSVDDGASRIANVYTNNIAISTWASGFHYNNGSIPEWNSIFPGWRIVANVFTAVNGLPTFLYMSSFEKGNVDLSSPDELSFTDLKAGNLSLSPASWARGAATDRGALGADVSGLLLQRKRIISGILPVRQQLH